MKHYIKSTVCIVGSGFCGYAAYLKLTNQNIDVILVEGGEFTTPPSISSGRENDLSGILSLIISLYFGCENTANRIDKGNIR